MFSRDATALFACFCSYRSAEVGLPASIIDTMLPYISIVDLFVMDVGNFRFGVLTFGWVFRAAACNCWETLSMSVSNSSMLCEQAGPKKLCAGVQKAEWGRGVNGPPGTYKYCKYVLLKLIVDHLSQII